ncbi:MAG: hypothetical protein R3A49_07575 [Acidimicrobiia bacterium]
MRRGLAVLSIVLLGVVLLAAPACSGGGGSADGEPDRDGQGGDRALSALDLPEVPSSGCDAGAALPAGDEDRTVTSGSDERSYILSIPPAYDGATPLPVVVDYHGYLEGSQVHARTSGFRDLGDVEGFITVTPQGLGEVPAWNIAQDGKDVDFTNALLDQLEADLCIDRSQVYAAGFSNGAMLTSTLACTTTGRFAAVMPVAGILTVDDCDPDHPMPAIIFHGTDDQFVVFDGGLGAGALDLPTEGGGTIGEGADPGIDLDDEDATIENFAPDTVPERATTWALRNGCDGDFEATDVSDTVGRRTYTGCPYDGRVVLYVVDGGGHAWPGSEFTASIESVVGATTMDVDATELGWEFFSEQRREIPATESS